MRVDVQVASAFFSGVNFLLALAIHFGTFYIFSAGRQFGSIYPALSFSPNRCMQWFDSHNSSETTIII
jgi:hypothetical protein